MRELDFLQTNGERLQTEHLDIKDLEAIEKRETPATKQVRLHSYSLLTEIYQAQLFFDSKLSKMSFVKGLVLQVHINVWM